MSKRLEKQEISLPEQAIIEKLIHPFYHPKLVWLADNKFEVTSAMGTVTLKVVRVLR